MEIIKNEKFIEQMKIQIYKRLQRGDEPIEIAEEMKADFARLFVERGVASSINEALVASKNLTMKIFETIINEGAE